VCVVKVASGIFELALGAAIRHGCDAVFSLDRRTTREGEAQSKIEKILVPLWNFSFWVVAVQAERIGWLLL